MKAIYTLVILWMITSCNFSTKEDEVTYIPIKKNKKHRIDPSLKTFLPIDSVTEAFPDIKNDLLRLKILLDSDFDTPLQKSQIFIKNHFLKMLSEKKHVNFEIIGADPSEILNGNLIIGAQLENKIIEFQYRSANDTIYFE